jgi:SAM-dependent methyltransferase
VLTGQGQRVGAHVHQREAYEAGAVEPLGWPAVFPLLVEPTGCPLCGAAPDRLRALHVYANTRKEVVPAPNLALLGCERCGLVHSHPLPTAAQLEAYYGTTEGWEARMRPEADVDAEAERAGKLAVKHQRYARERDLLAPCLPAAGEQRRVLDFGCGLGAWLDVLQDDGWETWGIEPGPQQREIAARRHRMVDQAPAEPTFELIVVNHVFEHLPDPLAVMRRLAAAAVPAGKIFVSVPDLGRLGEHGKWNYVKGERHICSYTASSLSSLLGLAGFRVVEHLANPEWDALAEAERWRLKILAERVVDPIDPSGAPLQEALEALTRYAERHEEFEVEKRERKRREAAERRAAADLAPAAKSKPDRRRGGLRPWRTR